jgi:MoxR-like ATPase
MPQAAATAGSRLLTKVTDAVHERVVGQRDAVEGLLVALLTGGHILLEGLPGLAKTLMVRTLAQAIHTDFRRIQFTPDLLPTDIVGTPVFDQASGQFRVQKGPIFSNIILADEINRAPPKVQAALLEAMEERQVTIAGAITGDLDHYQWSRLVTKRATIPGQELDSKFTQGITLSGR